MIACDDADAYEKLVLLAPNNSGVADSARLLERLVDAAGGGARSRCIVLDTDLFRHFDADRSGFVDLDEFCGMREVIRFLLSKFPTGDYEGRYEEEESDGEDQAGVCPINRTVIQSSTMAPMPNHAPLVVTATNCWV